VPKCPRHFSTGAEVSRIFRVVPKCLLDISAPVPKCLGSEVSKVRSFRTPKIGPMIKSQKEMWKSNINFLIKLYLKHGVGMEFAAC